MIPRATAADLAAFRAAIADRLGLTFDDGKLTMLAETLERRAASRRASPADYVRQLRSGLEGELRAIAPDLTVNETYFFRHGEQMKAFAEGVLPERLAATARPLQILSAGCSTGEEAYTLAILVRQHAPESAARIVIRGFDLNAKVIEHARRGTYSPWSLRDTPQDVLNRWFVPADERAMQIAAAIREAVQFDVHNLARADDRLWAPGTYDVVFCRNVLMYMKPEAAQAIVARIARALVPGGTLFLGHAETLRGLSNDFHLVHTHGTFYYQLKDDDGHPRPPAPLEAAALTPTPAGPFSAQAWIDAVQRSSDRIQVLAESVTAREAATAAKVDEGDLMDLVAAERFADALALLPALETPTTSGLLLRAVLNVQRGHFAEAAEAAEQILAQDELDASARYVLALCCEGTSDLAEAAEQDRIAVYLDPFFAMPRLHLGLLARRSGRKEEAEREMTRALELLETEDAARLVLFGGGFGREGLVALCRAELTKLGGAR